MGVTSHCGGIPSSVDRLQGPRQPVGDAETAESTATSASRPAGRRRASATGRWASRPTPRCSRWSGRCPRQAAAEPGLRRRALARGAAPGPYDGLRAVLLDEWDAVRATVLARATQTNEVGRCATLLPVLAALPGPLALLEVGASAGLCLYPDRYSYRYTGTARTSRSTRPTGRARSCWSARSTATRRCRDALPEVVWRGGVDLNPLDVRDDDAMRWLETLVWPEHDDRRRPAGGGRRAGPRGPADAGPRRPATRRCRRWSSRCPPDATLVVFHSAVLAYLSAEDRDRFVAPMAATRRALGQQRGTAGAAPATAARRRARSRRSGRRAGAVRARPRRACRSP